MGESPASNAERISVMVVDDHAIVRYGLTALLEHSPRVAVVATAASGSEAVALARVTRPRVILMDLMLPDLNGVDASRQILAESPTTRIVALSACHTGEHIVRALRAGMRGYVLKQSATAEVVHAVLSVAAGNRFLSPAAAAAIQGLHALRTPLETLSGREREVLQLTAGGASSTVIAQHLHLSPKTVETYRSRLMQKLGVANRTALIHFAIEHALHPL